MISDKPDRNGLESVSDRPLDPPSLFLKYTKILQRKYAISKGLLVIRDGQSTRFVATATISEDRCRVNLSLRLPSKSSLFDKVAEGGILYLESCCEFFSGNRFERNLLLDDDSSSFVIVPLKQDSEVVGILAYSSDQSEAFATFEDAPTIALTERLAEAIAEQHHTAPVG